MTNVTVNFVVDKGNCSDLKIEVLKSEFGVPPENAYMDKIVELTIKALEESSESDIVVILKHRRFLPHFRKMFLAKHGTSNRVLVYIEEELFSSAWVVSDFVLVIDFRIDGVRINSEPNGSSFGSDVVIVNSMTFLNSELETLAEWARQVVTCIPTTSLLSSSRTVAES